MPDTDHDLAVFIGRFQPFHNGHLRVLKAALEIADKVLVLVGSSNLARTTRNPFTFVERRFLIQQALPFELFERVWIAPLPDCTYDDQRWIEQVQHLVAQHTADDVAPRVVLVGNERDHTSAYLRMFPKWTFHAVLDTGGEEATNIRKPFFSQPLNDLVGAVEKLVPDTTWEFLVKFRGSKEFGVLRDAGAYYADYEAKWGPGPHLTADAVVISSGHVLLIRRGAGPEEGMLALPGGFLDKGETVYKAAVRELYEETKLRVLHGAYRTSKVYDDPHRSPRARIVTVAHLFNLGMGALPHVQGEDDAKEALWVPFHGLRVADLFEDHAFIIKDMLGKL